MLTVPSQLGVEYNAALLATIDENTAASGRGEAEAFTVDARAACSAGISVLGSIRS
jgi:hypothetical protein